MTGEPDVVHPLEDRPALPELHLLDGDVERRVELPHSFFPVGGRSQALLPDRDEKPTSLLRVVEIDAMRTRLATALDIHRIAVEAGERLDVK